MYMCRAQVLGFMGICLSLYVTPCFQLLHSGRAWSRQVSSTCFPNELACTASKRTQPKAKRPVTAEQKNRGNPCSPPCIEEGGGSKAYALSENLICNREPSYQHFSLSIAARCFVVSSNHIACYGHTIGSVACSDLALSCTCTTAGFSRS